MNTILKELNQNDLPEIRILFRETFTGPPWNENWQEDQLENYLKDLTEVRTPVMLGMFVNDTLTGVSLGNIRHWCGGTEYHIEELFIRRDMQNRGYGTQFLTMIEEYLKARGIHEIFLITDRHMPACEFYRKLGFTEIPEHISFFKEF